MSTYSRFVADIGGTHARFALIDDARDPGRGTLVSVKVFKCADFDGAAETVKAYQSFIGGELPSRGCIAAAGPVDNGEVSFTNLNWHISEHELRETLQLQKLEIVNDFAAVAYSVANISPQDIKVLYANAGPNADKSEAIYPIEINGKDIDGKTVGSKVVLGAGTGLGMAALTSKGQLKVIESEGGHQRFAPANEFELKLLNVLLRHHDYVSMEMLLSGPGITLLYHGLAEMQNLTVERFDSKTITERALSQRDPLCTETMVLYSQILAGFCTEAALNFNARGGVYLVGDIFRSIQPLLLSETFRQRYLSGGKMTDMLRDIPVSLVLIENPGLTGAAFRALNS